MLRVQAENGLGFEDVLQFRPGVLCGGKLTQKEVDERSHACTAQQLKLLRASRDFKAWNQPDAKSQRTIAGMSFVFLSILIVVVFGYLYRPIPALSTNKTDNTAISIVDQVGIGDTGQTDAQQAQAQEYDKLKLEYERLANHQHEVVRQNQQLTASLDALQKKSRSASDEYESTLAAFKEDIRRLVEEKQSLLNAYNATQGGTDTTIAADDDMENLVEMKDDFSPGLKQTVNDVLLVSEGVLVLLTVFYLYSNFRLQKATEKTRRQYIVAYQRQQAVLARAEDAYREIAAEKVVTGRDESRWAQAALSILNTLGDLTSVGPLSMDRECEDDLSPDTFTRLANELLNSLRSALNAMSKALDENKMHLAQAESRAEEREILEAQIEQLTLSLADESSQKHKAESRVASLEADLSSLHFVAESLRDQVEHLQEWAKANSLTSPLSSPAVIKQLGGSPRKQYRPDSPGELDSRIRTNLSDLWQRVPGGDRQEEIPGMTTLRAAMLTAQVEQIAEIFANEQSDGESDGNGSNSNDSSNESNERVLDKLARAANKFSVAEQYLSQQLPTNEQQHYRDNDENNIQLLNVRNFEVDVPIKTFNGKNADEDEEEERTRRFVATVEESIHQVENSLLVVVVNDEEARTRLIRAKEAVETSLSTVLMAQTKAKRARSEYDAAATVAVHRQREMEEARRAMEAAVLDQSDQSQVRQAAKKLVSAERAQQEASENAYAAETSLHRALKMQLSAKDELRSLQQDLLNLVESLYTFQQEHSERSERSENGVKEAESVSPKLPLAPNDEAEDVFDALNAV